MPEQANKKATLITKASGINRDFIKSPLQSQCFVGVIFTNLALVQKQFCISGAILRLTSATKYKVIKDFPASSRIHPSSVKSSSTSRNNASRISCQYASESRRDAPVG